ncbi:MAG: serine protease [Nanoarchaeota archaeon]|nr:serine protease [Nanoarchaeota archaeon]
MLGAIFKLSYNKGIKDTVGGICGSCFFIDSNYIITANHILNKDNFKPNDNYRYCQYWVLSENFVYEIFPNYFKEFPETDLTIIKNLKENKKISSYKISKEYSLETECYNEGFMKSDMPLLDCRWEENKIIIEKCNNLENLKKHSEGKILFIGKINLDRDVKLKDKRIMCCAYGGHEGMSGGPLIKKDTGEVIGRMSFGLPPDKETKENLFAVSIEEIKIVEESLK